MRTRITAVLGAGTALLAVSLGITPAAHAAPASAPQSVSQAAAIEAADAKIAANAVAAGVSVTEQLHDSLPATADAVTYTWSGMRFANYLRDDGSWTGLSQGYRVLTYHDSTTNSREVHEIQFTGNVCDEPNPHTNRLSFAAHAGGANAVLLGTGAMWVSPATTTTTYCNWQYIMSSSQTDWLNNAFVGTWTVHIATYAANARIQSGHTPAEAIDAHTF